MECPSEFFFAKCYEPLDKKHSTTHKNRTCENDLLPFAQSFLPFPIFVLHTVNYIFFVVTPCKFLR